jgi:hypothetical protein
LSWRRSRASAFLSPKAWSPPIMMSTMSPGTSACMAKTRRDTPNRIGMSEATLTAM